MTKKGGRWGYTNEQAQRSQSFLDKIHKQEQDWIQKKLQEAREQHEKKVREYLGEGCCLTCYKKIPKEAEYCSEVCESIFL